MRVTHLFLLAFSLLSTGVFAQKASSPKKPAKKVILSSEAPQPVGPYSQGIVANGFLFVAGQIGANPQTRQLVTESFEAEATQVLENVKAILKASGLDFRHVVKATVFLKDIGQYAKMNEIYARYFTTEPPAREAVQVANLPGNANIEISVIAAME